MGLDRAISAFAAAVLLVATVYGPLFPVVELPRDQRADGPVFEGFGIERDVSVSHQLSYRVVGAPTNATFEDGIVTTSPTTVAVAAGEDPVTLRYRLRVDNRTTARSVVVPAGETRTAAEPLGLAVEDRPANATLRIDATTGEATYPVYSDTLEVSGRA